MRGRGKLRSCGCNTKVLVFLLMFIIFSVCAGYAGLSRMLLYKDPGFKGEWCVTELNTIVVTNNSGKVLYDYSVRAQVPNYGRFIKIVDQSGNDVDFCYEQSNGECDKAPTNCVWFKARTLAEGENIFRIVLSSQNAAKNGGSVFLFYDDFNDGVVDTGKWELYVDDGDEYVEEVDGSLLIHEHGDNDGVAAAVRRQFNLDEGILVATSMRQGYYYGTIDEDPRFCLTYKRVVGACTSGVITQGVTHVKENYCRFPHKVYAADSCGACGICSPYASGSKWLTTSYQRSELAYYNGHIISMFGGEKLEINYTPSQLTVWPHFFIGSDKFGGGDGNLHLDFVYIRKYIEPEPFVEVK